MSKPVAELIYTPHGTAELCRDGKTLWTSDGDDDFSAENPNEFLCDDEDTDMIIGWLVDLELLGDGEPVDVVEESLEDAVEDDTDE